MSLICRLPISCGGGGARGKEKFIGWVGILCVSKLDGGLGLWDFEDFNLALLGKQCWRLIQNETTLCYRVLKARYFPQSSIFRANID